MINIADVKWIKLKTNMFDDEKIQLIDAMPERDTVFYIWIRLLVQAGKTNANGYIYLSENVPYTDEMLSTLFKRPINSVRLALKTLKAFGMIDILDNHLIKVVNWSKHQNAAKLDEIREYNKLSKRKQRDAKKLPDKNVNDCPGHVLENEHVESDIDIDSDIDKEREKESKNSLSLQAVDLCKYYSELKPGQSISAHIDALTIMIDDYSFDWCKEALQKTVSNKGYFIKSYMEAILKNWKADGKEDDNGTVCGDSKQDNSGKEGKHIEYDFGG